MKVGHLVYKREMRFSEQYVFTNVCVLITFVFRRTELHSLEVAAIATPLSYPPGSMYTTTESRTVVMEVADNPKILERT